MNQSFRREARRLVAIAGWLVCGWLAVVAEADAADGFTLFMPSGAEQRLLVVRAEIYEGVEFPKAGSQAG